MPFKAQEKKERSLTENIVIVLLIALLMASFIHYFFKGSEQYNDAGFSALANAFSVGINNTHAQWVMDNRPTYIRVKTLGESLGEKPAKNVDENSEAFNSQLIPLNKKGWVDIPQSVKLKSASRCEEIWHYVLDRPLLFMKKSLSVIEVVKNTQKMQGVICQYLTPEGSYFSYDTTSGKVSQVIGNQI